MGTALSLQMTHYHLEALQLSGELIFQVFGTQGRQLQGLVRLRSQKTSAAMLTMLEKQRSSCGNASLGNKYECRFTKFPKWLCKFDVQFS